MSVSPIKQAKEPLDPRTELSPARQALANARKVRAAASSILETASAAQQRAERLIAAPVPLKSRLAELERAAAGAVEAWARNGTSATPTLPGGDELDGLRKEINEAERVAEAARAAIPALANDIAAAQSSASAALSRMREAVAAVLVEEEADAMAAELIETERRAATLRGRLRAMQHHFQLDAMRGNRGVASFPDLIRKKLPERIAMTDPEIQRIAPMWTAYAERLLADETATANLS